MLKAVIKMLNPGGKHVGHVVWLLAVFCMLLAYPESGQTEQSKEDPDHVALDNERQTKRERLESEIPEGLLDTDERKREALRMLREDEERWRKLKETEKPMERERKPEHEDEQMGNPFRSMPPRAK